VIFHENVPFNERKPREIKKIMPAEASKICPKASKKWKNHQRRAFSILKPCRQKVNSLSRHPFFPIFHQYFTPGR